MFVFALFVAIKSLDHGGKNDGVASYFFHPTQSALVVSPLRLRELLHE